MTSRRGHIQVDGNSTTLSMSVHFKQLKRLVEEPTFSQVLIPLQSVLIPTLPSTGGVNSKHDAFPGHWAYLDGFDDAVSRNGCWKLCLVFSALKCLIVLGVLLCLQVEILASLQKPKKISLRGSDGRSYTMMCKPKDDLRKDCRLMEFNCLINKVRYLFRIALCYFKSLGFYVHTSYPPCSVCARMPSQGGGSCTSARTP